MEGGDSFWSSTHWGTSGGRAQKKQEKPIAIKTAQVRFQLFPMLHPILFLMIH